MRLASRESEAAALGLPGAAPLPPITNIVFMGMGEPLHNLSAVMSAVDILCDGHGLQFSHNKVGHTSSKCPAAIARVKYPVSPWLSAAACATFGKLTAGIVRHHRCHMDLGWALCASIVSADLKFLCLDASNVLNQAINRKSQRPCLRLCSRRQKKGKEGKAKPNLQKELWLWLQVTVSTVGLVPQLRHFVQNSPAQLAVSLHATTDEVCQCCLPTCLECFIMFVCNACTTLYLTTYHDRLVISLFNLSPPLCKLCQHHVTASYVKAAYSGTYGLDSVSRNSMCFV